MIPGLLLYYPFDTGVNSTGGAGTGYIANFAPGAINTSDTTGDLVKIYGSGTINTTTFKYGVGSFTGGWAQNAKSRTLPQNGGLSFSIWIYLPTNATNNPLFGFGTSGADNEMVYMKITGTSGAWNIFYNSDNTQGTLNWALANTTWHHVAWTISPATFGSSCTYTFYLNGTVRTTVAGLYPTNITRAYTDIMSYPGNGGSALYLDSFRYYARTLSSNEVNYIYTTLDALNRP